MPDETTPYAQYTASELILRDQLAIDRTILANERTLLAYIRTALALLIVSGTLFKFFDAALAGAAGVVLAAAGFALFGIGAWRYRNVRGQIEKVRRH
jgi:putative membrane protein